jgi:uncharacterized protein
MRAIGQAPSLRELTPINPVAAAAVLDTNVVLDWLVFRETRVAALAAALERGRLRWLATLPMRAELARMLVHANLRRWSPDVERALATFDRLAEMRASAAPARLRCTDPDDQAFIDLALAEPADWLITHDRALLKLARRALPHGVGILTPAAWCTRHGGTS